MMKFHLFDWPVKQVEDSKPQQRAHSKPQQRAPDRLEGKPPLNRLLQILQPVLRPEPQQETDIDAAPANLQIESTTLSPTSDVVVEPSPNITSIPMVPTPSISTDQNEPKPLFDWPVKQVEDSKPQQRVPDRLEDKLPLNRLLEILQPVLRPELQQETDVDATPANLQIESTTLSPTSDVVVEPSPDITSIPMGPTPSISTDQNEPKPYLRKAIVAPDIHTLPIHRFRAIDLRWVLRDIKGDRLKLSPINEEDLQDLIDLGLIEMRDDGPVLTSAGMSVIS
jgi:hypothetical protein